MVAEVGCGGLFGGGAGSGAGVGEVAIQSRRYLGNKYRLLGFIREIVAEKCGAVESVCDVFAGTGSVGACFNAPDVRVVANDFLYANYVCLRAFLAVRRMPRGVGEKVAYLNALRADEDNYFSVNFGGTYFSAANARKIGRIRAEIERMGGEADEKAVLLCALIYAADKAANTVGHYDAFRKNLDAVAPIRLRLPRVDCARNACNEVYCEDANALVGRVACDVLYVDPPYNSRQYGDAYHLLENLATWRQPEVVGVARKMDRSHIKSAYCRRGAGVAFGDLVARARCRHILVSYNNTGESRGERSNARMRDAEIVAALEGRGEVAVFERGYRVFSAGRGGGGWGWAWGASVLLSGAGVGFFLVGVGGIIFVFSLGVFLCGCFFGVGFYF